MKTRRSRSLRAPRSCSSKEVPGFILLDVAGEPMGWARTTPIEPAEQRWLEHVCALSLAASAEIHGAAEIGSSLVDVCVIGRAAEQLWDLSPNAPAWRDLDVDALLARVDREMAGFRDMAVATLAAFLAWMRNHGHLSARDHLALHPRVEPHFAPLRAYMCAALN